MGAYQTGLLLLAFAVPLALVGLTISGARRRGNGPFASGFAGLVFPLTWVAWYVRDEHQRQR